MAVKVRAPGSCGELVQGMIDGQNFLITCPIDLYSEAVVGEPGLPVSTQSKVRLAVSKTLEYLGRDMGPYSLSLTTQLPVGKGMASSSADISAACQAAALAAECSLTPDEIADIALAIEPTDGIFYPGIMMFDHVSGSLRRSLGCPPGIILAVFDIGGEIDTEAFNLRRDLTALNKAKEKEVRNAVELVIRGLENGDSRLIGEGATLSAIANQRILAKPKLDKLLTIALQGGAVGLSAAHSGTVVGIMFDANNKDLVEECIPEVQKKLPEWSYLRTVNLISGGLTTLEVEEREKA